jgi:hypothetical protein
MYALKLQTLWRGKGIALLPILIVPMWLPR